MNQYLIFSYSFCQAVGEQVQLVLQDYCSRYHFIEHSESKNQAIHSRWEQPKRFTLGCVLFASSKKLDFHPSREDIYSALERPVWC